MTMNTPETTQTPLLPLMEAAGQPPEGVDMATMLIASTSPRVIEAATDAISLGDFQLELMSDGTRLAAVQALHDHILASSTDEAERTEAAEMLQQEARQLLDIKAMRGTIADEVTLAREVQQKQHELSKPARWLAGTVCAIVVGGGTTALLYETMNDSAERAVVTTQNYNLTAPKDAQLEMPSGKLDGADYAFIGGLGAITTGVGGSLGALIGLRFNGPVARTRAKRQVRRAAEK